MQPVSLGFDSQHPLLHEYILSGLETPAGLKVVSSKQLLLLFLLSQVLGHRKLEDDVVFQDFFALCRSEVIFEDRFCPQRKQ